MTAALDVILTGRLPPRRHTKPVRGSIFELFLDKFKRSGIADIAHALCRHFVFSAVTAALDILVAER